MATKKLQQGSKYERLDKDGDGVVCDHEIAQAADPYSVRNIIKKYDLGEDGHITQEEMDIIERIIGLESQKAKEDDRDKREDAQRRMAWFALGGMLLYPVGIMIADSLGLEQAANLLSSIAPTYFVAIAGLVAAFFGTQAWASKKDD
jgi:hypothetical protein